MRQGKKLLICSVLGALSMTGSVYAAAPVYQLQGITVTAIRQAESLQSVPGNVQIVTEKQIKERNIQSVAQAVAIGTGIQPDQSLEGDIKMRGYDSKNILVMVDGQRVNSGWNGQAMWNMIPVDNISKIEVVRGGQSALYGGRAVGGVINIITKTQKQNGVHGSALVGYGSNNTWKQDFAVSGKQDKFSFGAFYENRTTDGWRTYQSFTTYKNGNPGSDAIPGEGLDKTSDGQYIIGDRGRKYVMAESYGFNLGYDFNDDQRLTYKYSHTNYHWQYNDPRTYVGKWSGEVSGNGGKNTFTESSFLGTNGWRAYDMHSLSYNDQKAKLHAHIGMTNFTRDGYTSADRSLTHDDNYEGGGSKYSYPSKIWDFDINKRWNIGAHTVLLGATYGQEKFDETISKKVSNWKEWESGITPQSKKDQWLGGKSRSWSVYTQDKWSFSDKWTAYIGGRYDHYTKYGGYSQYRDDTFNTYDSSSYGQFSPKLSLDYAWNDKTNLYVSYGKSFTPPLLFQVYRAANGTGMGGDWRPSVANPDLKPETTTNWEFGIKKTLSEKTHFQADVFYADTNDYIDLVKYGDNDDKGYKQYSNVGEAKSHGFEFNLNHQFSDKWSSYVDYTWQIGKVTGPVTQPNNGPTAGTFSTHRDYDLPRHLFHTGVTYNSDPWTVTLDGMFMSSHNDPINETGKYGSYDPYFILNLDSNYQINKETSVQFSIYNVLNREFYDNEVTAGRTYNVAVRYTF